MRKSLLVITAFCSNLVLAQTAPATSVQLSETRLSYEVPTIDVPGTVYSLNNSELTSGVDGRLHWIAEAGTLVQAGDLIAQLDPVPLQLQKAELDAQLNRAQLQANYFANEYQRLQNLQQSQSVSLLQLDKDGVEVLLPIFDGLVQKVQRKKKELYVKAPEGLIDLYLG